MAKFIMAARTSELRPGEGKLVIVHDKPMALFNVDGAFYAINYICPHMAARWEKGNSMGWW